MIVTLVYRGSRIGKAELFATSSATADKANNPTAVVSAQALRSRLSTRGEWYTGILEPFEAYARVRSDIRALSIALDGAAGLSAEAIRDLLLVSKREHARNGIELQNPSGQTLPALDITVMDYGTEAGPLPGTPFVSLGVLMPPGFAE